MAKYPTLRDFCLADTMELLLQLEARFNGRITKTRTGAYYLYIDNGADTLAVAHLDTVADYDYNKVWDKAAKKYVSCPMPSVSYKEFYLASRKQHKQRRVATLYSASTCVQSIALDDRLGLWVITEVLPALGVKSDFLFTTDEEIGRSTAGDFETSKEYNWIYEFDRRGFDPVLYQFDDPAFRQLLSGFGYNVVNGAFSDISELDNLGCKAINFGVGYDYEHTSHCVASVESVINQAHKFAKFWTSMHDTHIPHVSFTWGSYNYVAKRDDDLNWAYFRDQANWEMSESTKTAFDLGELACDFCGSPATHVVNLDGDYYLCGPCYLELYPAGQSNDEAGIVDENGRVIDVWDDTPDYNTKTVYLGGSKGKGKKSKAKNKNRFWWNY